jgi:hypothetical protein
MARYRRRDSFESRVSEAVEAEGLTFTADLIAKHATGVAGYRVTLAFFELDGPRNAIVQLPAAASRAEVEARADSLRADPDALARLLAERLRD